MIKRISLLIAVALMAVMMMVVTAAPAFAAPIYCQGNQTAQKTADGWQCINNGEQDTGSGRHNGTNEHVGHSFP